MTIEAHIKQILDSLTASITSKRWQDTVKVTQKCLQDQKSLKVSLFQQTLYSMDLANFAVQRSRHLFQKIEEAEKLRTDALTELARSRIEASNYKVETDSLRSSKALWEKRFEKIEIKLLEEKLTLVTEDLVRYKTENQKLGIKNSSIESEANQAILELKNENNNLRETISRMNTDTAEKDKQITEYQKEKEALIKELANKKTNLDNICSSKNEQETRMAELLKTIATMKSEFAANLHQAQSQTAVIKHNLDNRIKSQNKEIDNLKLENKEAQQKLLTKQKRLDKTIVKLSVNNQNLLKLQTKEAEMQNEIYRQGRAIKDLEDVVNREKSRNSLLANSLKECIVMGKRHRQQIMELNEQLNNRPIPDISMFNGSAGKIQINKKVESPGSKIMEDNSILGTPTKLNFGKKR